jgi:hypothetical protein
MMDNIIKRNDIKDGKGIIHLTMQGGTFTTEEYQGEVLNILPCGLQINIQRKDGQKNKKTKDIISYEIDINKVIEMCVADYDLAFKGGE